MEALYVVATGIADFMNSAPPFFIALICLVLVGIPMTLLHELGHGFAARYLLGGSVEVSVGNAGRIAEFRLGQIATSIKLLSSPTRVSAFASFDRSRATARDLVWIALAGPLASLAGVLLARPLYSSAAAGGVAHGLLWAAVLEGVLGALNLIPFTLKERRNGPSWRSDGGLALDAIKDMRQLR
jgi:hypothetical protein